ncbi:peptidylprolyl isomerase [Lysobacter sp. TY2-98]|uniref:peptidylprolyl isomerase n=1 Tax=Lysobacter sp. TY2-98 TaxID=2290922 RepID=UPI001F08452B|nr:peptidylprolyl isomerase [Lysobacter sp. TY2-98]
MQEIIDGSKPTDWRPLDPQNTLYMDLANGHRVVIELAPHFSPQHVANARTFAKEGYWNGLAIMRSQDNFVVQWGDPEEDAAKKKPLGSAQKKLPAEFTSRDASLAKTWTRLPDVDGWAPQVGFADGFPAGHDAKAGTYWMAHCYGAVGAGRNEAADSSDATELYVVTGQAPRQLDRNMSMIGRVVQGMEWLSTIPRGAGAMGFFDKPEQRVAITSIKLAADVPAAERTKLELMRTDSKVFNELVESRRNRRDAFYKVQAHHIDLCNVPLPVREAKG